MSLLKQLKWNLILLAVIFIALGIVAFGNRSGFSY